MTAHGSTAGLVEHARNHSPVCEPCLSWACAIEKDRRDSYHARLKREDAELVREFLALIEDDAA